MQKCALYLVRDQSSGAVKIGISKHPEKRLAQIADHYNVGRVSIVETTWFTTRDEARTWEANFHKRYERHRSGVQGGREWFNLTASQMQGFIDWMEASTSRRAFKVVTVKAEAQKSPDEIFKHRWQAFLAGTALSFFTGLVPVIGLVISGGNEAGLIAAPLGVGVISSSRVKKKKTLSQSYGLDGFPVGDDVPRWEYMQMKLWSERTYILDGEKSPEWKLPRSTSPEQAMRFFERGK